MSDSRIDLATALGIAGAGAALFTARRGRLGATAVSVASSAALAALASRSGRESRDLESRVASMSEQIRQLETAVAAQVQGRMAAEEAVKSLTTQLAAAEKRVGEATELPVVLAEQGVGGEGLTDQVTGLFNHDYFLVALDSRIAAARRHLRPVAVALLDVVPPPPPTAARPPPFPACRRMTTDRKMPSRTRMASKNPYIARASVGSRR